MGSELLIYDKSQAISCSCRPHNFLKFSIAYKYKELPTDSRWMRLVSTFDISMIHIESVTDPHGVADDSGTELVMFVGIHTR